MESILMAALGIPGGALIALLIGNISGSFELAVIGFVVGLFLCGVGGVWLIDRMKGRDKPSGTHLNQGPFIARGNLVEFKNVHAIAKS